jgi:hypothetical protein
VSLAVSADVNAGFVHWLALLTERASGARSQVEAFELEVFRCGSG